MTRLKLLMSTRFRSRSLVLAAQAGGALLVGGVGWHQQAVAAQTHAAAHAAHAPHWSYEGAEDPVHWAALAPEFAACGAGHEQSPIDIVTASATGAPSAASDGARFDRAGLGTVPVDIVNNGHTIQIDAVGSGVLVIGKDRYVLQQFHFHTPSEHTIDGRSFPLEAHFVHKTAGGKLAVVGLLFEEGAENPALTPYWSRLPKSAGPAVDMGRGGVDISKVLPASHDVYRYFGSLTTPPCSEGVEWFVMKAHATASPEQIEAFRSIMHHDNRPVQPLADRAVRSDVIR
jgi:carbonic anhydrase